MVKKYPVAKTPLPPGTGTAEAFCVIKLHAEDGTFYTRGTCRRCKEPVSQNQPVRRVWGAENELFHEPCWVEEREDPKSDYFTDPNE